MKHLKEESGKAAVIIIVVILLLIGGGVGWYFYSSSKAEGEINDIVKEPSKVDLTVSDIKAKLKGDDFKAKLQARKQIGKLPAAEKEAVLLELANDTDVPTRILAAKELGKLMTPAAKKKLEELIGDLTNKRDSFQEVIAEPEQAYKVKLLSPAQMEKIAGKERVAKLTEVPDNGVTLKKIDTKK